MNTKASTSLAFCLLGVSCIMLYASSSSLDGEKLKKQIQNYHIDYAVTKCQETHDYSKEDMIILSQELKRYFILCGLKGKNDSMGMYSSDVDNLWHAFILYTKEYAQFGQDVYGYFLHHAPRNKHSADQDKKQNRKDFINFIKFYENIFGEQIHPIWMIDMAKRLK